MRLLDLLRSVKRNHHHVNVTSECRKDIKWWKEFLPQFNGVSIIYTSCWSSPDEVFAPDACLTGCGGCSGSRIFHKEFPADVLVQFPFIHQLECLAILVAVRLWGSAWKGLRLTVFCDNEAVVQVLNSGKTREPFLESYYAIFGWFLPLTSLSCERCTYRELRIGWPICCHAGILILHFTLLSCMLNQLRLSSIILRNSITFYLN